MYQKYIQEITKIHVAEFAKIHDRQKYIVFDIVFQQKYTFFAVKKIAKNTCNIFKIQKYTLQNSQKYMYFDKKYMFVAVKTDVETLKNHGCYKIRAFAFIILFRIRGRHGHYYHGRAQEI